MTHPDLHPEDLIERERRGDLAPAERQRLLAHLAACRACAVERSLVGDVARDAARSDVDAALLAKAASGAIARARPRPRNRILENAAAAIVLLLLGSAAGAALWSRLPRSRRPVPAEQVAPPPPRPVGRPGPAPMPAAETHSPVTAAPAVPIRPIAARTAPIAAPAARPTAAELFARANEARRRADDPEAVRVYRELFATFPDSREASAAHVTLGRLLLDRVGDVGGALSLFDSYLAVSPAGTLAEEARLGRALALGRLGRAAEERAAWEDLLARHPDSIHAPRARARLDTLR
jgi:TolA-binding protein